ncbi:liprin-beta-1b isoform X2 [Conger conger]|uniref:liprin-beta-1b isoform X2 n=1 Tax=Conger conger TaxID=82655 RepID=UPI002A5B014C|nr:liprin-beta-1b isoform X2 [Conger conger]
MMSDASDMLAAALEQMDGIIAGSKALEYSNGLFDCQSPTSPFMGGLRALHLVEDLRGALELMDPEERDTLRCQIPDSTADSLAEWLQGHLTNGHISMGGDVYQERLSRLESDKESLVLQVSVLTDQVEAQGEKIRDLDLCLEEHREKLNATEDMLQQELLSRTSLETQKLELMAEVSNLKLKLTSTEKDRLDYDGRLRDGEGFYPGQPPPSLAHDRTGLLEAEFSVFRDEMWEFGEQEGLVQEINELRYRVSEMENERVHYEKKLKSTKEELATLRRQLDGRDGELKMLQEESYLRGGAGTGGADGSERDFEVQRMKKAVESLLTANEEKDRKIEELRAVLGRYRRGQDTLMSQQAKKDLDSEESHSEDSVSASAQAGDSGATDLEKATLIGVEEAAGTITEELAALTQGSAAAPTSDLTEAGEPERVTAVSDGDSQDASALLESPSCSSQREADLPKAGGSLDDLINGKGDEKKSMSVHQTPAEMAEHLFLLIKTKAREELSKISTLPPRSPPPASASPADDSFGSRKARSSFGRGFFKIRGGKRTASAPNLDRSRSASAPMLAETEREGTDHLDLAGVPHRSADSDSTHTLPSSPEGKKKSRGIKKLFGKLKRSQSTTFNPDEDMSETEFKRGGVRATAGPRLGWSRDLQRGNNELDTPFARWTKDQVCAWLQEQGLGVHVGLAKQWITSGQTLLQASQHDLERELGIKHALHRKKLQLALQALGSEEDDNKGKLDYSWVTRWLDDIGLPQYKTQFDEGRVDGRMLHYMTVDDLLSLKVGSVLHHLSIKRAIQVLRLNNYEPNCLRRRPSDENHVTPAEISQWTNHRVMEWLRSVDLAEYAPNLRGSGVHGGLMVLEPRFNVETMALLLNIPPSKTLLRRHLATHFHLLVGDEAQHLKQEQLECPDYTPLTATAKVKPKKLSFGSFGSLRRRRQEDSEEYVCPMDVEMPKGKSFQTGHRAGELHLYEDDLDRLQQMEDSEGTVRQIGAFSEGINNLTSLASLNRPVTAPVSLFPEYAEGGRVLLRAVRGFAHDGRRLQRVRRSGESCEARADLCQPPARHLRFSGLTGARAVGPPPPSPQPLPDCYVW